MITAFKAKDSQLILLQADTNDKSEIKISKTIESLFGKHIVIKVDSATVIDVSDLEEHFVFKKIYSLPVFHAPDCPCERILDTLMKDELEAYNQKYSARAISKAAVALIFDKSGKVLVTRRNKNLSIFPGNWVFPGGKVDNTESFLETVLREVKEEVGLNFASQSPEDEQESHFVESTFGIATEVKPLNYYESVFPISISDGHPKSHHFICFYTFIMSEEYTKVNLQVQPEEVDMYSWIDSLKIEESIVNQKEVITIVHALSDMSISYNNTINKENSCYYEQNIGIDFSQLMSYGHQISFLQSRNEHKSNSSKK